MNPKKTSLSCWCCGEELSQLQFLNDTPTCDDCRAAEEEARILDSLSGENEFLMEAAI